MWKRTQRNSITQSNICILNSSSKYSWSNLVSSDCQSSIYTNWCEKCSTNKAGFDITTTFYSKTGVFHWRKGSITLYVLSWKVTVVVKLIQLSKKKIFSKIILTHLDTSLDQMGPAHTLSHEKLLYKKGLFSGRVQYQVLYLKKKTVQSVQSLAKVKEISAVIFIHLVETKTGWIIDHAEWVDWGTSAEVPS